MTDQESIDTCPVCGEKNVTEIRDRGTVCQECGLVHNGNRWSETSDRGIVSDHPNDGSETEEWQDGITIRDASDKQLVGMLSQIESAAQDLRLTPEVRNHAADILIEAWTEDLMHGRDREGVIGASLYLSCRELNDPRPTTTVASAVDAADDQLRNGYQVLLDELELYHDPPDASDYLSYLGEELRLTENSIQKASDLLSDQMIGGNPAGVAAGALYVVSRADENITLADAGEVAGVTKETVWRKARDLK